MPHAGQAGVCSSGCRRLCRACLLDERIKGLVPGLRVSRQLQLCKCSRHLIWRGLEHHVTAAQMDCNTGQGRSAVELCTQSCLYGCTARLTQWSWSLGRHGQHRLPQQVWSAAAGLSRRWDSSRSCRLAAAAAGCKIRICLLPAARPLQRHGREWDWCCGGSSRAATRAIRGASPAVASSSSASSFETEFVIADRYAGGSRQRMKGRQRNHETELEVKGLQPNPKKITNQLQQSCQY